MWIIRRWSGRGSCNSVRCNYCNRYDHIEADCRTKAREQQQHPGVVVVAQPTTVGDVTILADDYNEFLQFKAAHQPSSAQSSNHVAFISTSSSLGLRVLDSAASDHMTGITSFRFHDLFLYVSVTQPLYNLNIKELQYNFAFLLNMLDRIRWDHRSLLNA